MPLTAVHGSSADDEQSQPCVPSPRSQTSLSILNSHSLPHLTLAPGNHASSSSSKLSPTLSPDLNALASPATAAQNKTPTPTSPVGTGWVRHVCMWVGGDRDVWAAESLLAHRPPPRLTFRYPGLTFHQYWSCLRHKWKGHSLSLTGSPPPSLACTHCSSTHTQARTH